MCDELGSEEAMVAYVEEYAKIVLCSVEDDSGCSDKEKAFIAKMKGKEGHEIEAQLQRLSAMDGESMKPELSKWITQRIKILKQLVEPTAASDEL